MQLQDIVPNMSKLYLNRTVSSFLKDVRLSTEDEMRQVILKNLEEFQNEERVKSNLDFTDDPRNIDVLNELLILCLIEQDGYISTYSQLIKDIENLETSIVNDSNDDQYINSSIPETAKQVYSAVLAAAWDKDESLNSHEKNMLEVLRTQLGLTRRQHRLLESKIGRFPQKGNKLHGHSQIDDALKDLQTKGIVLRFKADDEYFVIPEEIARTVRYTIGGELKRAGFGNLLEDLRTAQLKKVLASCELRASGTKSAMIDRIQRYDILPSTALNCLSSSELSDILRRLPDVPVSGDKRTKVQVVIDHYENFGVWLASDPTDDRAIYFDWLHELATRDYKTLRGNGVIDKDVDVERCFEEGTRYLFEKKLGLSLWHMDGSKHADGRLKFGTNEVVLWDNKSTERPYDFPENHFEQFQTYIRGERFRPSLFLVIVGDYATSSVSMAQKLKAHSGVDTDVALIKACDLKFVANHWSEYSNQKSPVFDLEVFNLTGELTRDVLTDRMSWVLGQ